MPRGRKPIPSKLRILGGDKSKGKDPINTSEPSPPIGCPPYPRGLSKEMKVAWDEWAPQLVKHGLLSIIDGIAFRGLLKAYVKAMKADRIIDRKGFTVMTSTGTEIQRAEVAVAHNSWKLVKDFCSEFGLTPASRSRIKLDVNLGGASKGSQEQRDRNVRMFGSA